MPKTSGDFTPEQERAVATADARLPASAIVGMAQAGELAPGLAPFNISKATVQRIRHDETARKAQAGQAREQELDSLDRDIIGVMRKWLTEIESESEASGKRDYSGLRQLTAARKNMRDASYVQGRTRSSPEQDDTQQTQTPSLLTRLSGTAATDEEDEEGDDARFPSLGTAGHAHAREAALSD